MVDVLLILVCEYRFRGKIGMNGVEDKDVCADFVSARDVNSMLRSDFAEV